MGGARGGGLGGGMGPLLPYITMGALGLDPIVYIEWLFSCPQWMTNFTLTNQIENCDQFSLGLRVHIILRLKRTASWKLQCPIWQDRKNNWNKGNVTSKMSRAANLHGHHADDKTLKSQTDTSALNTVFVPNPMMARVGVVAASNPANGKSLSACLWKQKSFYHDINALKPIFSGLQQSIAERSD